MAETQPVTAEMSLTKQNKINKPVLSEPKISKQNEKSHTNAAQPTEKLNPADAVVPHRAKMADDTQPMNLSLKSAIFHDAEHDWNELINELVQLLF